ncbi:MAG: hypothetical protein KAI82_04620, partial [Tritonibacter mobilis]|nr:hypothetical protein [Tritonibacter mobilis]
RLAGRNISSSKNFNVSLLTGASTYPHNVDYVINACLAVSLGAVGDMRATEPAGTEGWRVFHPSVCHGLYASAACWGI